MGRDKKKPIIVERKKYRDISEGWIPVHVELPPIEPSFKDLKWSVNVEVLLDNNIVIEGVYYRYNMKVWSKHNSKKDYSYDEVKAWRNML